LTHAVSVANDGDGPDRPPLDFGSLFLKGLYDRDLICDLVVIQTFTTASRPAKFMDDRLREGRGLRDAIAGVPAPGVGLFVSARGTVDHLVFA